MNCTSAVALAIAIFGAAALNAQSNPFSDDARQHYSLIKPNLLRAAEIMPEEHYSFRTVPEVRTFGEMIAHVADAQFRMSASRRKEVHSFASRATVGGRCPSITVPSAMRIRARNP